MAARLQAGWPRNTTSSILNHGLFRVANRKNILHSLVSILEIVLDLDVVGDLEEDGRSSDHERDCEQDPVADEFLHKRKLASIQIVHDSRANGLYALVKADIVGQTTAGVGESAHVPNACLAYNKKRLRHGRLWSNGHVNLPVNARLPNRIVETVKDVQEHGADISRGSPVGGLIVRVQLGIDRLARVVLLVGVAAAPKSKSKDNQDNPSHLGTNGPAHTLDIDQDAGNPGGENLREIVQEAVERLGARRESCAVDTVLLIDVEPVGGEEHGEQQHNQRLEAECLPETEKLALPAGVLFQNDTTAILSNNVIGVAEQEGEDGAAEHEDDEANVGAIGDGRIRLDVDVFPERDLGREPC